MLRVVHLGRSTCHVISGPLSDARAGVISLEPPNTKHQTRNQAPSGGNVAGERKSVARAGVFCLRHVQSADADLEKFVMNIGEEWRKDVEVWRGEEEEAGAAEGAQERSQEAGSRGQEAGSGGQVGSGGQEVGAGGGRKAPRPVSAPVLPAQEKGAAKTPKGTGNPTPYTLNPEP